MQDWKHTMGQHRIRPVNCKPLKKVNKNPRRKLRGFECDGFKPQLAKITSCPFLLLF